MRRSSTELLLVLAACLGFFALPLGRALVSGDVLLCAVDTATAQRPWSAVIEPPGAERPRNPALADHGTFFYPMRHWVAASWLAGDPPLWNPWIWAGAPALGNPQVGVLDPQVLAQALLWKLFGPPGFDRGFALLAWLRLGLAATGAWLLARQLGLSRRGAALAALGFGGCGFLALWLVASLAHVACFLPWVLLFVERSRAGWRGAIGAALALALSIFGGHPETAFYVGVCALVWALAVLRDDRAGGTRALLGLGAGVALALPVLAPFLRALPLSGALVARRALPREPIDLLALGWIAIALGGYLRWRRLAGRPAAGAEALKAPCGASGLGGALVLGVLVAGLAWALDPPAPARLLAVPDLYGAPGIGRGYLGPGTDLEEASAWLPALVLALAVAAAFTPPREAACADGRLRRRALCLGLGAAALLLALRAPGAIELYRRAPLAGLGATARLAPVAALMLALLAGEALDVAPRAARWKGACAVLALAAFALLDLERAGPRPDVPTDPDDEIVAVVRRPPERIGGGALALEGWIHPALPAAAARVQVAHLSASGAAAPLSSHGFPAQLLPATEEQARAWGAPAGARAFRAASLDSRHLAPGWWSFTLELLDERGEVLGSRTAAVSALERGRAVRPFTLFALAASLLVAALGPAQARGGWLALALLVPAAQVLDFARGRNPAVPRGECFPPTRTVAFLQRELGPRRYLADPGILPPSTGILFGLRCADGYDALDVADFNAWRPLALKKGTHPLLGWNAAGVDLSSPAFRLLGVGALLKHEPMDRPGWKLAAGPAPDTPEPAEVFIYVPRDPPPRAFCVAEVRELPATAEELESFDPFGAAWVEAGEPWRPRTPFARARVEELDWKNAEVRLRADLDGDGLLVLTDLFAPGWTCAVDGRAARILRVDGIFRGVALSAGAHEVAFSYRPLL